ncbi:MAG: DNA repair protein RecN [Myxococcaceae bacterium]|nr:DNA repair protein RecN [Myxococcaceae bacterium]
MLNALRISNFAVIDEAEVEFGPGLTVLTGETGAGKSILVDALGLLVGGRAEVEVIRAGAEEATVEGLFERTEALAARLAELGLPDLGEQVGIRRVIGRTGRGKAYVNGALVTVGVLSKLMRGLVDIAGQHEHVGLFDAARHLDLLDRAAGLDARRTQYREAYAALREVDRRIEELGGDERAARERAEFLRFQLEEIDRLAPQPGEVERLEEERRRLMGAERLRRAAAEAEQWLSSQEASALELVGKASALIADAARIDGRLGAITDRLASASAELEEAARALDRYLAGLDSDPGRLSEVDERLDALKRLCRKHGTDLSGVLARRQELCEELTRLENRGGLLERLMEERAAAEAIAWNHAKELTAARTRASKAFARSVTTSLEALALGKAVFEVRVALKDALGPDGTDEVEFLFSANPGEPPRPLEKVASGGEASRLLLAIKKALDGSDGCGCYVLDEADSGVSGAVAEVVGRMIKEVSAHRQVLCITHLPQVAAYADHHLSIRKEVTDKRTTSKVIALRDNGARTKELARMLAGVELTREAIGAAEALVRSAARTLPPRRVAPSASPRARRERRTG